MVEHRYPLTYDLRAEDPPLALADIEPGRGACDAVVVLSLGYPPDGSCSMVLISRDGRTGDVVRDAEIFRCWIMLARQLAESISLAPKKREFARAIFDLVDESGEVKRIL